MANLILNGTFLSFNESFLSLNNSLQFTKSVIRCVFCFALLPILFYGATVLDVLLHTAYYKEFCGKTIKLLFGMDSISICHRSIKGMCTVYNA